MGQTSSSYLAYDKINQLLIGILACPNLKALDLSKNKFHPENVMCLLRNIPERMEMLILSSLDGLNDEAGRQLIDMLKQRPNLKRLDISGSKLSSSYMNEVLAALIQAGPSIQHLDLSKCRFDGNFSGLASLL
jgi:Ran GTPase-activating protein (RanGAP) involved in mRNA processing and transport